MSDPSVTIPTMDERKEVETLVQEAYDPHALISVRRIDPYTRENTYPTYKATELEEVLNRINILEQRIGYQEKQIGQVIDNLTKDGWYSDSVDKEDVLRDLCDIFDHEAKQEVRITATINVELVYDIPLDEVDSFDSRYFLEDNLSIDSSNGDIIVESWNVEDSREDW
jgi:hypothetical protein